MDLYDDIMEQAVAGALADALMANCDGFEDVEMCYPEPIEFLDGSIGLGGTVYYTDGDLESVRFSVNIPNMDIQVGHLVVPDYSEHTGKAKALEKCGLGKIVGEVAVGYGMGYLMKMNESVFLLDFYN